MPSICIKKKIKLHVASVAVKQNRNWHRDQVTEVTHQRPSPKKWLVTKRQQWKKPKDMSEASAAREKLKNWIISQGVDQKERFEKDEILPVNTPLYW